MAKSSSEFQLPGETRSEGMSSGDSTVDSPFPFSRPPKEHLDSTVSDGTRSSEPSASPGTVLGDFRIEELIGEGSMGEVYRATQLSLNRTVALKLLPPEFESNEVLVERFLREMQSLAELDHPHIVRVLGTGEEDGQRYSAMEFIDGQALQDWARQVGPMAIGDVLHIGLVCSNALKHSHDRKKIHRDIKAGNILLTRTGLCKVADFGLVKVAEADMGVTGSGMGLGTPEYMAPEQTIDASNVDGRVDIYSMGILLYFLATGELPFKGESVVEFLTEKQRGKYKPVKSFVPSAPDRFDLVIQKMLQAEPDRRYADFGDVMKDLASIGQHNDSLSFVPAKEDERYVAYGPWSSTKTTAATATALPKLVRPLQREACPNQQTNCGSSLTRTSLGNPSSPR